MRKLGILFAALFCALATPAPLAIAQAPAPVPALPDTERRATYAISAATGPYDVNFPVYGDGIDYSAWVSVWLDGVRLTPVTDWTLGLASGSLTTSARPLTNARITLTTARTGTLQIVGDRRPRRTSQFAENRGVAARDLNQVLTDITAWSRESWDRTNDINGRALRVPPGEVLSIMPPAASRAGKYLTFDGTGAIPQFTAVAPGTAGVSFPSTTVVGDIAVFNNTAGTAITNRPVDYINVKNPPYSAVCDGTTVDTTAIQTAATAAAAAKVALYFPSICRVAGAIDVSGVPRIFCSWMGIGGSNLGGGLISTSATANILSKNSTTPITIENCAFQSTVTRTAGAGILLAGNAEGDTARSNFFSDSWRGIQCDACIAPFIVSNHFVSYRNHALHLQNTVNPDTGDGIVAFNIFDTTAHLTSPFPVTVAVFQVSSGGWIVTGNKFLRSTNGYYLDRDSAAATSILRITDNSFDTQVVAGVVLQATGTGTFGQVIVANNIFSAQDICVDLLGANANITQVSFTGGICNYSTTGANLQAGAIVNIAGVTFQSGGSNTPAVTTAAAWPNSGEIGRNFYNNTNTRYVLNGNTAIATIGAGPPRTAAPALTACGTSPGINGDDRIGFVQMGTGTPTGCVITFAVAYPATPRCIVNWRATPLASQSYTYTTTAITLTQTATSSNFVDYRCDPAN